MTYKRKDCKFPIRNIMASSYLCGTKEELKLLGFTAYSGIKIDILDSQDIYSSSDVT